MSETAAGRSQRACAPSRSRPPTPLRNQARRSSFSSWTPGRASAPWPTAPPITLVPSCRCYIHPAWVVLSEADSGRAHRIRRCSPGARKAPGISVGFPTLVTCPRPRRGTVIAELLHREYPSYFCPHPGFSAAGEVPVGWGWCCQSAAPSAWLRTSGAYGSPRAVDVASTDSGRPRMRRPHDQA